MSQIKAEYLDNSEDQLLKIFTDKNSDKLVDIALEKPSWPIRYHLSKQRENLLNWYPFSKESNLLEVGAGCGALTGLFLRKLKKVTAVELTEKRAEIIRQRFKGFKNLTVFSGNIDKFESEEKFDFVTSIGVLEYAGLYLEGENPYLKLLKLMRSFLNEKGTMILAIENKFGLKYWAGCREDHTGEGFDSLEDYPRGEKIKTFGKLELENLLIEAGFSKLNFYFPLPDYKMPVQIFSDKFLPGNKMLFSAGLFPTVDLSNPREYLFSEFLVANNLAKANLFPHFANSFLVFCGK